MAARPSKGWTTDEREIATTLSRWGSPVETAGNDDLVIGGFHRIDDRLDLIDDRLDTFDGRFDHMDLIAVTLFVLLSATMITSVTSGALS